MEIKIIGLLSLASSLIYLSILRLSTAFTPVDNYLINCGSSTNVTVDNRLFTGDLTAPGSGYLSSSGKSISLTNPNPSSNSAPLSRTARVFTSASSYEFNIKKTGTHLFILMVNDVNLELSFVPSSQSGFALVNAIEVFSAPEDLMFQYVAKSIGPNGVEEFKNLSSQILETVHRINVGGSKLTPFNDTLWRIWIPDEDFLVLKSAAKTVSTTHAPNYEKDGANREIAPDNVYMTAQQLNSDNLNTDAVFNITWDFPVSSEPARYFIRLHFCDIVSRSLNQLYFNVFINGFAAYKDLDLSALTFNLLASPYYIDFVVGSDDSGVVRISVGPSDLSSSLRKDAILNGVEIMKMVNFFVVSETQSEKRSVWVLVGSIVGGFAFLCLVGLAVLLILRGRRKKQKPKPVESMGWTPLRLQETGRLRVSHEVSDITSSELPGPRVVPQVPSSHVRIEGDDSDGISNITTSRVFSQLMTKEGR
ncbi:putative receptor-like protein kinase [Camellia lanceoleosa]|uniref:Receptor-like protein kinase n=1 Tax=Camellia lanceoleosa TaxID=1840588 RepID=A0ACC0J0M3_9ERIC|nr:putative receptor-like protein kinase [Camellia lanceoleosa]